MKVKDKNVKQLVDVQCEECPIRVRGRYTAQAARKGGVMDIDEARKFLRATGIFFEQDDDEDFEDLDKYLNLNDVWGWACSDLQKVEDEELPELARLFKAYGWCGVLYWVSEKRGGCRSEFHDNNRFIDFVRQEEAIQKEFPDSSTRAYVKRQYVLGVSG